MVQVQEKTKTKKNEIWEWVRALVFALLVTLFLRFFIAEPIRVSGPSMQDTLFTGQIMLVYKTGYLLGQPRRHDVAVCHFPISKENYVKRVIGLPGETLSIEEGVVYIDGSPIEEPYVHHPRLENYGPITLGEDEYFMMGDNRSNSADSRDPSIGPLRRGAVVGKSVAVLWPLRQIQIIRHAG